MLLKSKLYRKVIPESNLQDDDITLWAHGNDENSEILITTNDIVDEITRESVEVRMSNGYLFKNNR